MFIHGMAILLFVAYGGAHPEGPVAEWRLDEGAGEMVSDATGSGIAAYIRGAVWARCGETYVLQFETQGAHVNCGNPPSVAVSGPISLEAWAYPTRRPDSETGIAGKGFDSYGLTIYGDGAFYWYVSGGGNKCSGSARIKEWNHIVGTFDGETMCLFLNGKLENTHASQAKTVASGGDFLIGCIGHGGATTTDSFRGFIGGVRVYSRALAESEVQQHYAKERSLYRTMEAGSDRITVHPYVYSGLPGAATPCTIFADIDLGSFHPLIEGQHAELSLWRKGEEKPLIVQPLPERTDKALLQDVRLDAGDLAAGEYEVHARVFDASKTLHDAAAGFTYPIDNHLPGLLEKVISPLPVLAPPPPYRFEMGAGGGFTVGTSAATCAVESTYSYPQGSENTLASGAASGGEADWRVSVESAAASQGENAVHKVHAQGAFYAIDRRIAVKPDHVLVQDTIRNLTSEPLGIILSNHARPSDPKDVSATQLPNPSLFLATPGGGVGLVALDDVYLEHHETFYENGVGGIRDKTFALDAGASYTLEWAVYVNITGDYHDFINAVRRDQGLVRTVDGGFAFMDRREPPTEEFVKLRGLKYLSIGCLGNVPDDPGLSIEGIEFTEYPKECELLKRTFDETKRRFPECRVMFHVAHSLYTTNQPDALFPDSRTLNADGKQTDYGDNNIDYYVKYFSKERVDEGYRWFIFYPAKDNRFGPAFLKATDFMLDQIGATGLFADGLTHGYGGRFTYDRWDGHTAEIDPQTKTIRRKYASVNLLADPILIEVARKVQAKDGVVIANSYTGTRTFNKENVLYCIETGGGDKSCSSLYLAPSVIALGDGTRIHSERDLYDDIRAKIEWGSLYYYYGEGTVTHTTPATYMYPITVDQYRPGLIKGRERLITTRAGVYGWPGDRSLHQVYRFDARGMQTPHAFTTGVDQTGVRTELDLKPNETAVLRKIPLTVTAGGPANCRVEQYDGQAIDLRFHGDGELRLDVANGDFAITAGASYSMQLGGERRPVTAKGDVLSLAFAINGETRVRIEPAIH